MDREAWCPAVQVQSPNHGTIRGFPHVRIFNPSVQFSSVQSPSHVQHFATPWTAARQASLSITNSRSLLKLMSIESVMPSNRLILCYLLLLVSSVSFCSKLALCIRWTNYWSFIISPSNEYLGLISFKIDWFDFLAVQWTLRHLFQHHKLLVV